jgi:molecular chaperone GrpE
LNNPSFKDCNVRDELNSDRENEEHGAVPMTAGHPEGQAGSGTGSSNDEPGAGSATEAAQSEGDVQDAVGADAQRVLDEQRDKYLRLAAEYDNYRKRSIKERLEAGTRAQADLVKQLIDPLDDLARVTGLDPATVDVKTILEGITLVEKKLMKALTSAGLEVINPIDQTFNPELHEAVATEPALSREDDHLVSQVYQPGYLYKGQLLRPARVVVKQWNG